MGKILDRLLLFIYTIAVSIAAVVVISVAARWINPDISRQFLGEMYGELPWLQTTAIVIAVIVLLIGIRLFILSVRTSQGHAPSIDQRNEMGDIRISIETVENLALKAATRVRGIKDLKARIRISQSGLEIVIRTIVDGDTSIPGLSEEVQKSVKEHVEEVTGIPVAFVSVFVANVVQTQSFRSRVE